MKTKKTIPRIPKKELAKYLVKHYTNKYGVLNLSNLDFRKYDVVIDISGLKTNSSLHQRKQVVGGILQQDDQTVGRYLLQDKQTAKEIYQSGQTAKEIYQTGQSADVIYTHKPFDDEEMIDKKYCFKIVKKEKNNENE